MRSPVDASQTPLPFIADCDRCVRLVTTKELYFLTNPRGQTGLTAVTFRTVLFFMQVMVNFFVTACETFGTAEG